jgi:hypothetical protein
VEEDIDTHIDELVKVQVAKDLDQYIPKTLQDELAERKLQLEEVQRALHNSRVLISCFLPILQFTNNCSESRRANAELRSSDTGSCLHTIYPPKGVVSALFPRTLRELFALDGKTRIPTCENILSYLSYLPQPRHPNSC